MSNSNVIKCSNCSLVNFATALFCKRCRAPFHSSAENVEGQTVNININFPAPIDKININTPRREQTNYQPQQPQFEQFQPPQQIQQNQNTESYQPQNQTGFQQWQQMNAQMQPPPQQFNAQPYNPAFPHPHQRPSGGIYRHGKEVVVHKNAQMPERCVKCNDHISGYDAGGFARQKYRWHNPLVYIALISPLIYLILAAVLSQNATLDIPLCHKHLEDRKSTGKTLLISGIGSTIAIFFFGSLGYAGIAFLLFLASVIGLPIAYNYLYKPLQISKIENDYVYLKGVNDEYTSQLPYC